MATRYARRAFIFGVTGLLLAGCAYGPAGGPPPHAPDHGYRYKHPSNVVLIYDAGLGVYVVEGRPGYYWDGINYYRVYNGVWQVGAVLDGPWHPSAGDRLPPGLDRALFRWAGPQDPRESGGRDLIAIAAP